MSPPAARHPVSPSTSAPPEGEHLPRLLEAMARTVGSKGYATTTIADIVAEAQVSRRTFYEHFQTKADCLVALYEHASLQGLQVLRQELDGRSPWQEQVERALHAYLTWMARNPILMRTLFLEMLSLGPQGMQARRRVHAQLAQFIQQTVNGPRRKAPPSSRELSMAVIGGLHELVLERIEAGDVAGLPQLAPVAADLVRRVLAVSHT
ncbi:TetR/AcrR family transcriptional regulator [Ramlibacter sp. AN1015]|uniref:TetR/AcrR family transcriptional regulator n=1 Tax=Ramlibacter sp. AN1015 TaxID=3133428 RepID=UPI0030BEB8C5